MNEIEKSNRRVEMSAALSDAVYDYEKAYTGVIKGDPETVAQDALRDAGIDKDSYKIVDSMYDPNSGVAAIAVYDKLTKETYISYAGTNMGADGHKDPIVDLAIALNDSLYLKEKNKPALDFYDRVEASGYYISTTTGHSYGEFQAGRTAMESQVPSWEIESCYGSVLNYNHGVKKDEKNKNNFMVNDRRSYSYGSSIIEWM